VQVGAAKEAKAGLALIRKAMSLDPGNARWKEALESAEAEPIRRANVRALSELR
jgi:hypothetical protein